MKKTPAASRAQQKQKQKRALTASARRKVFKALKHKWRRELER